MLGQSYGAWVYAVNAENNATSDRNDIQIDTDSEKRNDQLFMQLPHNTNFFDQRFSPIVPIRTTSTTARHTKTTTPGIRLPMMCLFRSQGNIAREYYWFTENAQYYNFVLQSEILRPFLDRRTRRGEKHLDYHRHNRAVSGSAIGPRLGALLLRMPNEEAITQAGLLIAN